MGKKQQKMKENGRKKEEKTKENEGKSLKIIGKRRKMEEFRSSKTRGKMEENGGITGKR